MTRLWQLYRYRNAIRMWATDCAEGWWPGFAPAAAAEMRQYRAYAEAMQRPDGYAPNPGFREATPGPAQGRRHSLRLVSHSSTVTAWASKPFTSTGCSAWAAEAKVPVVLIDMPVSCDLQDGLHAAAFATYRRWLAGVEHDKSLRVHSRAHRDTVGLTDADFADFIHLNSQGCTTVVGLDSWSTRRASAHCPCGGAP